MSARFPMSLRTAKPRPRYTDSPTTDPHTQLPNRRLLQDRLGQAIAATSRTERSGADLFLDLNNFKILNDVHGHEAGNQMLTELAQRLQACVRACDSVAQLGGYQFVILKEDPSSKLEEAADQAGQLAEKIQTLIAMPVIINNTEYQCSTQKCYSRHSACVVARKLNGVVKLHLEVETHG